MASLDTVPGEEASAKIGRPVRVVSIGYKGHERALESVVQLVDSEGSQGTDVIALAETWRGLNDRGSEETLNGPAITAMAALARKHRTYIVCPIDRKDGAKRFNSAVLLDREGRVASVYNKVFPWFPEYRLSPPVEPGETVVVHQADFGRVGFAICFDLFFNEVWQRLADQGAELVIYPSDSSGGTLIRAQALNYHYYIVTCTHTPDCQVFDITGEEIVHKQGNDLSICRITLDLDRGVYNTDSIESNGGNLRKLKKLLKDHGDDVIEEKYMELDGWFVLKARRPGVSARELATSYGMEELREFISRSRRLIDERRGWPFVKRLLPESGRA
jgi:predicted amidohydrolase